MPTFEAGTLRMENGSWEVYVHGYISLLVFLGSKHQYPSGLVTLQRRELVISSMGPCSFFMIISHS